MVFLELLAPALDKQTAIMAINHGVDAVYMGAEKFGARNKAYNTLSDIEEVVNYAHLFNVKVFITVNTIFFDYEAEEIRQLCYSLWNLGVDAMIIQDVGILELDLPPMRFHMSTQANNRTVEQVLFWEKTGLSRVILARELSLKQIAEIRSKTTVELEAFIHGALCVSYSGNCYMSYVSGGRSANRGNCAQLCRLPYDLVDSRGMVIKKNQHLISLRDLNASPLLPQLIQAGVTSFKIEGRLKDISYVKNITAYYHALLNNFIKDNNGYGRTSKGDCTIGFAPDPERTFSRLYSTYFYQDRKPELANFVSPKSVGKFVGNVVQANKNSFLLDHDIHLVSGDGICFIQDNSLIGTQIIGKISNGFIPQSMNGIVKGVEIYRNRDREFNKQIEKSEMPRKKEVIIYVYVNNNYLEIVANTEGFVINNTFEIETETSNNQQRAVEIWKNQLSKTGNSVFRVAEVKINTDKLPHYSVSRINELRRILFDILVKKIVETHIANRTVSTIHVTPFYLKNLDFQHNVANRYAKSFYEKRNVEIIEPALELQKSGYEGKVLMTTRYCILYELDMCLKINKSLRLNFPLWLKDDKREYQIEFDCKKCEMILRTKCR